MTAPRLAWSVCGLAMVLVLTGPVLLTVAVPDDFIYSLAFIAVQISTAVVGAVVASRLPENAVGWILLTIGTALGLSNTASTYGVLGTRTSRGPLPADHIAAWVGSWTFIPVVFGGVVILLYVFPDGRFMSTLWRRLAQASAAIIACATIVNALLPGRLDDATNIKNPVAATGWLAEFVTAAQGITDPLALPAFGLAAAALVVRFRRSRGVERQQLKWISTALVVVAVSLGVTASAPALGKVPFFLALFALAAMPVATGMAMLRYRLYDIDVVISRTLLVAGLVGFITAAYVGIVVGVGSLLGGGGGEPNIVLSVVATTVVAVLFQPVRVWLQRVANRLVFGHRSTPYDVLSGFATRVGAGESSPESLVHLAELVAGGTGADPARVWLRVGSQLRADAVWPVGSGSGDPVDIDVEGDIDAAVGRLPGADLAVPVVERGELLGVLTIAKPRGERVTEVDVDLVERLAAASGVVLRNLRLDAELGQRLEDLEASRRRLVSAQDDARRRIEADLAGGSRAELGLLRDQLTVLAADVDSATAPKTAMLLGQLVDATDGALDTLAGLAAGVYPPRLAADGLVAALTEQAGKAALPVQVHAEGVSRYAPEVEAAAYFAVLECLQNVAKYAGATTAQVKLNDDGEALSFEVVDDGAGFDTGTTTLGTGLQGITDRLDTVNGTLTITSTPSAGTTITGHIPTPPTAASVREPELAGATR